MSTGNKLGRWLGALFDDVGSRSFAAEDPACSVYPYDRVLYLQKLQETDKLQLRLFTADAPGFGSHTADYLDEWEKKQNG
ncbi:hypothetical protein GCM10020331_026740 [Ectobacillus funiculus]